MIIAISIALTIVVLTAIICIRCMTTDETDILIAIAALAMSYLTAMTVILWRIIG